MFLIICTTTELEYLLHTEGLCASPSAEAMQATARIFCLLEVSAEFRFHADAFLSYLLLIFTVYFPHSPEHKQQMQPYMMRRGFSYTAAILKFSHATVRLLHSCEEVRVLCARLALEHRPLGEEQ